MSAGRGAGAATPASCRTSQAAPAQVEPSRELRLQWRCRHARPPHSTELPGASVDGRPPLRHTRGAQDREAVDDLCGCGRRASRLLQRLCSGVEEVPRLREGVSLGARCLSGGEDGRRDSSRPSQETGGWHPHWGKARRRRKPARRRAPPAAPHPAQRRTRPAAGRRCCQQKPQGLSAKQHGGGGGRHPPVCSRSGSPSMR